MYRPNLSLSHVIRGLDKRCLPVVVSSKSLEGIVSVVLNRMGEVCVGIASSVLRLMFLGV